MSEPPLWAPSEQRKRAARLTHYLDWLAERRGVRFESYPELWQWSVTDLDGFWRSVWDYFEVRADRAPEVVLGERAMPGAQWFPGARLNYAEHALRRRDDAVAVLARSEGGPLTTLTWAELAGQVGAAAAGLRRLGVGPGDRVAALLPNISETLVAFLATASVGAVWSSCAPEFGLGSVVDRFTQISPTVLLAVDGYSYGGREHDRMAQLGELRRRLPGLVATVLVGHLDPAGAAERAGLLRSSAAASGVALTWQELLAEPAEPAFEPVPFDHPLWILYSSGTTGLPKGIVQGHGGILLEHLKTLALHCDLGPADRFCWFTTTGWMMWNFLVSGLLVGAAVALYDGSPAHPDMNALWSFVAEVGVTFFGSSAPYVAACMAAGIEPGRDHDLSRVHTLGSTGAPLPAAGFRWLYQHGRSDWLVGSASGGTDLCTAFVLSCPLLPVHAGELQCRGLGAKVEAFDSAGRSVVDQVGELVISQPMPSMPLYLWGDQDGSRYRDSYFAQYPGVWRHGDWLEVTGRGSCVISGRSDATLNRGGVRSGTAEYYRVVEAVPGVADSLVVEVRTGESSRLELFVVVQDAGPAGDGDGEATVPAELAERIVTRLREQLSPRHVPDGLTAVPEVPRTLNGKKLEVPIKRILEGRAPEEAVNRGAVANPQAWDAFVRLATGRRQRRDAGIPSLGTQDDR